MPHYALYLPPSIHPPDELTPPKLVLDVYTFGKNPRPRSRASSNLRRRNGIVSLQDQLTGHDNRSTRASPDDAVGRTAHVLTLNVTTRRFL